MSDVPIEIFEEGGGATASITYKFITNGQGGICPRTLCDVPVNSASAYPLPMTWDKFDQFFKTFPRPTHF